MKSNALEEIKGRIDAIGQKQTQAMEALSNRVAGIEADVKERLASKEGDQSPVGHVSVPGVEADKFSIYRAVLAMKEKNWDLAPYEHEVFKATASMTDRPVSFGARQKDLSAGTAGTIGNIVPTEVMSDIIPLLRSKLILPQLGLTMMDMTGMGYTVTIPRHSTGISGEWIGENSAATSEDTQADTITLSPKKASAYSKYSNTLLRTGTVVGLEQFIRNDLMATLARLIQIAHFNGTGTNSQPDGILGQSGNNTVSLATSDDATILAALQQMINELEIDDVDIGRGAKWVMHPRTKFRISKIKYTGGGPILTGPYGGNWASADGPSLLGFPYFTTTDMPVDTSQSPDESDILLGVWEERIWANWGTMELRVTDQAGDSFAKDQTWVRVLYETDFATKHNVAFCEGQNLPITDL